MSFLDQFSPGQKQALMIGAPVAAGLALVTVFRKPKVPAQTGTIAGPGTPSTDAIGVGQLSDFESQVTQAVTDLANRIAYNPGTPVVVDTPAPPAPPDPTAQTPAPTPAIVPPPPPPGTATVVGTDEQGHPYVYGGTLAQAQQIVGAAVPPSSWGIPGDASHPSFDNPLWKVSW